VAIRNSQNNHGPLRIDGSWNARSFGLRLVVQDQARPIPSLRFDKRTPFDLDLLSFGARKPSRYRFQSLLAGPSFEPRPTKHPYRSRIRSRTRPGNNGCVLAVCNKTRFEKTRSDRIRGTERRQLGAEPRRRDGLRGIATRQRLLLAPLTGAKADAGPGNLEYHPGKPTDFRHGLLLIGLFFPPLGSGPPWPWLARVVGFFASVVSTAAARRGAAGRGGDGYCNDQRIPASGGLAAPAAALFARVPKTLRRDIRPSPLSRLVWVISGAAHQFEPQGLAVLRAGFIIERRERPHRAASQARGAQPHRSTRQPSGLGSRPASRKIDPEPSSFALAACRSARSDSSRGNLPVDFVRAACVPASRMARNIRGRLLFSYPPQHRGKGLRANRAIGRCPRPCHHMPAGRCFRAKNALGEFCDERGGPAANRHRPEFGACDSSSLSASMRLCRVQADRTGWRRRGGRLCNRSHRWFRRLGTRLASNHAAREWVERQREILEPPGYCRRWETSAVDGARDGWRRRG